ncbi:MAG: hypothetical protein CMO16_07255 [Thaumarchaeota archaeon]|nr:hypothetical protein [Nitrososphaerota archaeon]
MRYTRTQNTINVILRKGVKLHLFKPSNRRIWTIVGRNNEYWVDPENNFCSCKDYYFQTLSGKEKCYHLRIIDIAKRKKLIDSIEFSDDEYTIFLKALISDIYFSTTR